MNKGFHIMAEKKMVRVSMSTMWEVSLIFFIARWKSEREIEEKKKILHIDDT